ncbi:MAG: peptidylprolyl isomerase, partial [Cyclobacteriaceae bacterium]|nr:peptidylprolyl isomerase [Cyclobacteriaceae bacterium]
AARIPMKIVFWLTILLFLSGCAFNEPNKFSDNNLITIYSLQDRRKTDSLILFLLDKNPIYRAEAALALASVQDSIASLQLGTTLLEDPYLQARINAAFALGQTGGYAAMNAARDINTLLNFNPKDSIQQSGLAWGFYFAGMRGIANEQMAERATRFLAPEYSASTRLGAAHFFNRALDLKKIPAEELIRVAGSDADAQVRMAATAALRKLDFTICLPVLKKILSEEHDYRVRVNAARIVAAKATPDEDALILLALKDENEQVAIATAEALKNDFAKTDEALHVARSAKNFRLQTTLYQKLLIQNPALSDEIKKEYQQSTNVYHRAGLLSALSDDENSRAFLFDQLIQSTEPVIKTTAATAITTINRTKKNSIELYRTEFATMYKEALLNGDAGVIGIVASILADTSFNYKSVIKDFSFLYTVKKKLTLPRDYEAIQPLEEAIAYFEGKEKPAAPKNEYNHPIDWQLVKAIHKNQKVKVTTTQGDFSLELFVEDAPGTVANFVSLLNQKYFDEKYVHRMVPNFVIQTGCNRGDGYGSEPYSIRSEFSLNRYNDGSVGMASAGKDTEGTQWFVTHSPTPHLDGRYTLFANVTEGMEVVHKIQVGDKILNVRLQDN